LKHLLILISFLLLSSPLFGQSDKPQTIIIPTGSLGDISEVRKKMLGKTLESKLDDYFAIVPKELFEEAQEQAFQEMDSDECTEDQCIRMIQELLQVENSFKMDLMYEEGDTQVSITWNDQEQKRVEEDFCEGCKTKGLRKMIGELIDKLLGTKIQKDKTILTKEVVKKEVVKKELFVLSNDTKFTQDHLGTEISISKDGNNWSVNQFGTSSNLNSIVFSGDTKLMVGDKHEVVFADSLSSWIPFKSKIGDGFEYENLYSVIEVNGVYTVVGEKGIILSGNKEGFQKQNSGVSESLYSITYAKNKFVAVGHNGVIITSIDGKKWESPENNVNAVKGNLFNGISYGKGKFIIVSRFGKILTSDDAQNWSVNDSFNGFQLNNIKFVNNSFIIVGNKGIILTSENGDKWSKHITKSMGNYYGVVYVKEKYIFVGSRGEIISSQDLKVWETLETNNQTFQYKDIIFDGNIFFAIGTEGKIKVSSDSKKWADFSFHHINSISSNENLIVMVGNSGAAYTSKNGRKWDAKYIDTSENLNKVVAKKEGFAAVGTSGTIAVSKDSNKWRVTQLKLDDKVEEKTLKNKSDKKNNLKGVDFSDGKYIAVGTKGLVLVSDDGKTWRKIDVDTDKNFHDISFGNKYFVAVGDDATVFSYNNEMDHWTKEKILDSRGGFFNKDNFYGVTYANGNFFLVGDDGISASSTNWNINPTGIEKKLTDIVFVNSKYFAVGESGTLLSSINGQNWVQNKFETLLKIKGITFK